MSELRNKLGYRIGVGLWVDAAGDLHISITELLEHFEIADTPENRELVTQRAMAAMKEITPTAEHIRRAAPHCPTCNSQNCRVAELTEKADFCCLDCKTLFCEPGK